MSCECVRIYGLRGSRDFISVEGHNSLTCTVIYFIQIKGKRIAKKFVHFKGFCFVIRVLYL